MTWDIPSPHWGSSIQRKCVLPTPVSRRKGSGWPSLPSFPAHLAAFQHKQDPQPLLFPGAQPCSDKLISVACPTQMTGVTAQCKPTPSCVYTPQHHTCTHNLCLLSFKINISGQPVSCLPCPHPPCPHISAWPPGPPSSSDGHQQPSAHLHVRLLDFPAEHFSIMLLFFYLFTCPLFVCGLPTSLQENSGPYPCPGTVSLRCAEQKRREGGRQADIFHKWHGCPGWSLQGGTTLYPIMCGTQHSRQPPSWHVWPPLLHSPSLFREGPNWTSSIIGHWKPEMLQIRPPPSASTPQLPSKLVLVTILLLAFKNAFHRYLLLYKPRKLFSEILKACTR